jgi:predicted dienelactone hydrolase
MKTLSLLRALLISVAGIFLCLAGDAGAVGFQHVMAPDPDGAPLEIGIWYPSTATPAVLPIRTVTQTVAADAPVDGKALPLIVISHGTGGSYLGHYDTAIALAEAGFVVAAVTHTGDNYADQSRSLFILERPRHISRVIDYMLSSWSGRERIDAQKIGMFGFSAGGFTTLVSVGGRPDMAKIAPFCETHKTDFACQLIARNLDVLSTAAATLPGRDGAKDGRIKAAVVAAPALGFTFSPDGLRDVSIPVQLWRAENDIILPHPSYAEAVRLALPRPPEYHIVPGAGHFDFLAPCNEALAARVPEICSSAAGFDRRAFHAGMNEAVVEFFRRTLNAGR